MVNVAQRERNAGLKRTTIGGRTLTSYDPHLALEIVERVAEGETLVKITEEKRFPTRGTFMKWMARVPELREAYMAARELSALAFEEEAIENARSLRKSPGTAQAVRAADIAINQLRWSASRRDPKNYGDKGLASTIVPVTIQTTLNLGEGSKQGQAEIPDIYTIDVTPVEAPPVKSLLDTKKEPPPGKRKLIPRIPPETPNGLE